MWRSLERTASATCRKQRWWGHRANWSALRFVGFSVAPVPSELSNASPIHFLTFHSFPYCNTIAWAGPNNERGWSTFNARFYMRTLFNSKTHHMIPKTLLFLLHPFASKPGCQTSSSLTNKPYSWPHTTRLELYIWHPRESPPTHSATTRSDWIAQKLITYRQGNGRMDKKHK